MQNQLPKAFFQQQLRQKLYHCALVTSGERWPAGMAKLSGMAVKASAVGLGN